MSKIVFLIEGDVDGGYIARALGESIFTQADDIDSLKEMLRDAVRCHFPDEQTRPKIIRLHIVRDEVIASSNSRETCLVMKYRPQGIGL